MEMERRNFLRVLGFGVAGIAQEQAIPLGRVWSFPSEIVIPQKLVLRNTFLKVEWVTPAVLRDLEKHLTFIC